MDSPHQGPGTGSREFMLKKGDGDGFGYDSHLGPKNRIDEDIDDDPGKMFRERREEPNIFGKGFFDQGQVLPGPGHGGESTFSFSSSTTHRMIQMPDGTMEQHTVQKKSDGSEKR